MEDARDRLRSRAEKFFQEIVDYEPPVTIELNGMPARFVRYCQKSCIARHDQAAIFLIPSTNGTPEITSGIS